MTSSRSTTPNPGMNHRSPSRLAIPPALRQSPSLSNLRVHGHNNATTPVPPVPSLPSNQTLDSSANSVVNLDLNEGILVQDVEAEVDTIDEDVSAPPRNDGPVDEDTKKLLRAQLRKTLSHKLSRPDLTSSRVRSKRTFDPNELSFDSSLRFLPREYFVLTDAGKPVFTSRLGSENLDDMTSTIGIMQALISVFIDDGDKLRFINAGKTRITFLQRSPLYYVCVSSWGEPESVTRSHLEYLHLQILSVVTAAQLRKIFERRGNFDLRRLLNGAETFLTSMLTRLESDLAMSTSALHCMKLDPVIRKRTAEALVPNSKMKDILYVILVARGEVITLIRPKKHSIHPADIHILLNTIQNPSISNSPAAALWIPVCLPKFNPSGFVNAYISFMKREVDVSSSSRPSSQGTDTPPDSDSSASLDHGPVVREEENTLSLVCISGGGEFEIVRNWCDSAIQKLTSDGALNALYDHLSSGKADYTVSELGIPGLRHFVYKSRAQVQVTFPLFEDPYDSTNEQRRIITLYQILYDAIHAKSGQEEPLKLQYIKTEKESVLGWITQPFELYIVLSPLLPKSAAVGAANAVARWVKKDENRLFLRDAPVF